jgi:hypothetical protein
MVADWFFGARPVFLEETSWDHCRYRYGQRVGGQKNAPGQLRPTVVLAHWPPPQPQLGAAPRLSRAQEPAGINQYD